MTDIARLGRAVDACEGEMPATREQLEAIRVELRAIRTMLAERVEATDPKSLADAVLAELSRRVERAPRTITKP